MTEAEWNACVDGSGMLRSATGVDRKLLVTAACACARLALPFVPKGEERPLRAIEAAEGWVRGEVSLKNVQEASATAHVAYATATYTTTRDAAYAAVNAARTAVSVNAAYTAYTAAHYAAVRVEILAQCADLVREIIPYNLVAVGILEAL